MREVTGVCNKLCSILSYFVIHPILFEIGTVNTNEVLINDHRI